MELPVRVSKCIDEYIRHESHRVALGVIRDTTLTKSKELATKAREGLPDTPLSDLGPADFRAMLVHASTRWGALRLRHLAGWTRGWLKWVEEEGLVQDIPRMGRLDVPAYRPQAKHIYTPLELRKMLDQRPLVAAMCGLGLWCGMNAGDLANLHPDHFKGHWMNQPRHKTGIYRRSYVPSWVLRSVSETGIPIRTKYGYLSRTSVSPIWRDATRAALGKPRPFTGLRATLRTIAGHTDPEAVELSVMGLAEAPMAGTPVAVRHYLDRSRIGDDRLREVAKVVTQYVASEAS